MSIKEKLLASAQKNLEKGQIAKAIKDFQQLVAADPKDFRSRQKLAELFSRARQNEQALEEYDRVARHYAENGFYLKAIAVYKQMQKLDPARPEIYHSLADLNQKQGLLGNAMAEYRTLVAHYEQKKMYPEAVTVLQKMKDLEPEDLNIRAKSTEVYLKAKMKDKAREEFEELLRPLLEKEDLSRAHKMCELFLPHFPEDSDIKTSLAELQIRRGDVDRGIHQLKELLKKEPENIRTLRTLARGYHQIGDFSNERLIHQHLLKEAPDDLEIRQALVRANLDQGDASRALNELEEWKEAFCEAGKVAILQGFYEELSAVLPQEKRVLATLQSIYETCGDGEKVSALLAQTWTSPTCVAEEPETGADELLEGSILEEAVEDLEEIAELTEELEEPVAGEDSAEEIPLHFLESQELAPSLVAEEYELELELELDDAELNDLLAPGDPIELTAALQSPSAEPEADLIDLDLEELPGETAPLAAELEKIEFYLQQELLEEAAGLCAALLARFPQHPELLARQARLAEGRHRPSEPVEGFFDLGAEIIDEEVSRVTADALDLAFDAVAEEPAAGPEKKRVKTDVEIEDPESHYHLGIAYKEMGLLDDAVQEFEKAMRDPSRAADCLMLQGICLVEKGAFDTAEAVFRTGLGRSDLGESEKVNLHFELGALYESTERLLDALDSFQYVADHDLFFRGVGERISGLRQRLGLDEPEQQEAAGQGKKNRVSYV